MQKFRFKKFIGGLLDVKSKADWSKDIVQLFNVRKLLIYIVIAGVFAGVFYWKGLSSVQPIIDIGYKDVITMPAPKGYEYLDYLALHKPKDSNKWEWINLKSNAIYAKVKVGDIPEAAKLRPYGFESKIIGIMALGLGHENTGGEWGAGVRFARLWQMRTEIITTNKGVYGGVSYKPKKWIFENTTIGIGIGKGYKADNRLLGYLAWEF